MFLEISQCHREGEQQSARGYWKTSPPAQPSAGRVSVPGMEHGQVSTGEKKKKIT